MNWFSKVREFFREVVAEVKKVSFPSREEVVSTTIVVLIASFIMAIYLWLADRVIIFGYETLMGVFS